MRERRVDAWRGRPRTKGERLPAPPELADTAGKRDWHTVTIDMRGTAVARLIHTRGVLWYGVSPNALVRLVIVRDPAGVEPDDFFFSTDLNATGADIATRYAGRWSVEVCFRDTKQNLRARTPSPGNAKAPNAPPRSRCGCTASPGAGTSKPTHKAAPGSTAPGTGTRPPPSYLDALAALRRDLWAQRITTMSAPETALQAKKEITKTPLDTLTYAA